MMVPKTTSETLKHKINPSLDLAEPQTVHVLLYTPGTVCGQFELLVVLFLNINLYDFSHNKNINGYLAIFLDK